MSATGPEAISNYLGQSLIGVALFYGYGLGQGPVERAWRRLTYGGEVRQEAVGF